MRRMEILTMYDHPVPSTLTASSDPTMNRSMDTKLMRTEMDSLAQLVCPSIALSILYPHLSQLSSTFLKT